MQSQADLSQALSVGLAQMRVSADAMQVERLVAWLRLLEHWNRTFNLTAIPPARRVEQLVLPSAGVVAYLRPGSVADIGSGAGVPGIVLAILAPDHDYVLLDSNGKKTRFLRHCQMEIGLENVSVIRQRVECLDGVAFDTIVSRYFADLARFFNLTRSLAHTRTRWLAMKGSDVLDEIKRMPRGQAEWRLHRLKVPDARAFSLVEIECLEQDSNG